MATHMWDLAIAKVDCPVCFAKKGEPCIYLGPGRAVSEHERRHGSASLRQKIEQEGKPMPQGHYARQSLVSAAWHRQRRAQQQKAAMERAMATQPPWLRALREFDAREVEQMRTWLRENWSLFLLRRL